MKPLAATLLMLALVAAVVYVELFFVLHLLGERKP